MSENDYVEETMLKYLSEQYDKLMNADEKVKSCILSEYSSKDDYIKKNFDLYKSTSLDNDVNCLSEDELNFIKNSDSNKNNNGKISEEILEASKAIVDASNKDAQLTISIDHDKVILRKGINSFELTRDQMQSILMNFVSFGIYNLNDFPGSYIRV